MKSLATTAAAMLLFINVLPAFASADNCKARTATTSHKLFQSKKKLALITRDANDSKPATSDAASLDYHGDNFIIVN